MNKVQKRESRIVHRQIKSAGIHEFVVISQSVVTKNYKRIRRSYRKLCRQLTDANKLAHKSIISMDLANEPDRVGYYRQDLFNGICVAEPVVINRQYDSALEKLLYKQSEAHRE